MPKKALPAIAVAPIDVLTAPSPPSPLIQKLRTDWRWAAISQFVWMFSDAFGLVDWDIQVGSPLSLPRPRGDFHTHICWFSLVITWLSHRTSFPSLQLKQQDTDRMLTRPVESRSGYGRRQNSLTTRPSSKAPIRVDIQPSNKVSSAFSKVLIFQS